MSKKLKIIVIVSVAVVLVGLIGKFVVDRVFSMIFLHSLMDMELSLKDRPPGSGNSIIDEIYKSDVTGTGEKANENKIDDDDGNKDEVENEWRMGSIPNVEQVEGQEENKEKTDSEDTVNTTINNTEKNEINDDDNKLNGEVSISKDEKNIEEETEDWEKEKKGSDSTVSNVGKELKAEDKKENQKLDEKVDKEIDSSEKSGNIEQEYKDQYSDVIEANKEKIQKAEKEVSTKDKFKALDIVLRKLQSVDIENLLGILKKGKLSKEDLDSVKKIFKERVTEEEKEVLKELFNKYEYLIE